MEKVTVRQMIESLQKFDLDMPLEIAVKQANKRYPVAYLQPSPHHMTLQQDTFAICQNGVDVRIEITLPYDNKTMMITSTRQL